MRLFDLPQAKHFCAPSAARVLAVGSQSLPALHSGPVPKGALLVEGGTRFEVHQVNVLHSVQRWLVYSLAHYRRALTC